MTIKAVIFDLGNTLLYFDGNWPEVFSRANQGMTDRLAQAGLALDRERFIKDFRDRLDTYHNQREIDFLELSTARILEDTLAAHGFLSVREKVKMEALAGLYAASQEFWIPEEDLIPTMEALQLSGIRMGVISNAGDDRDVQTLVDKARIRPYLEYILTSAASGMRKPDHRIFALGLQFFGLSPMEVVMVGDTLNADILGANLMGITSVWITRRADTANNRVVQEKIKPNAVIDTLADLPELLRSLNNRGN
jgi:HAD superfamily hydrolase (TIGR01549 family)